MPGETSDNSCAAPAPLDRRAAIVLLTAAVALTLQEYLFRAGTLNELLDWLIEKGFKDSAQEWKAWAAAEENRQIARWGWWAIGRLLTYVLLPVLVVKLLLRQPLSDLGLRVRGIWRSLPIYLLMLAAMLPAVWYFSRSESFKEQYPFYALARGEALWPRFWIWELLYALQFIALEFFFRGFMLHGTKHVFGRSAIFVMMVPYVMLHFTKPMPETFGAIGAGLILGYMSLKTCSIWFGAGLHIAVAIAMDMLALANRGLL